MNRLQESQIQLYYNKYLQFEDDPRSLSWNNRTSQNLRFEKILDLFKYEKYGTPFTVHEVGCGLGHFLEFLRKTNYSFTYSGSDIIQKFIGCNREKFVDTVFFLNDISASLASFPQAMKKNDYYCLSGTFHTKEDNLIEDWENFIYRSMKNMYQMARKGICMNFLTYYSEFYDEKLYYGDPRKIFDWIIQNLSRFVTLDHEIPLYEFTVCVYKPDFIQRMYPGYKKYF